MFFVYIALICSLFFGPNTETEDQKPYVKIYSIHDLEMIIPNYTNVPQLDLSSALSGNQGGSIFQNTQNQNVLNGQKRSEEIINLIETFVEPEAWGDVATIRYWNGNLIIKAPKRIHDKLE